MANKKLNKNQGIGILVEFCPAEEGVNLKDNSKQIGESRATRNILIPNDCCVISSENKSLTAPTCPTDCKVPPMIKLGLDMFIKGS